MLKVECVHLPIFDGTFFIYGLMNNELMIDRSPPYTHKGKIYDCDVLRPNNPRALREGLFSKYCSFVLRESFNNSLT